MKVDRCKVNNLINLSDEIDSLNAIELSRAEQSTYRKETDCNGRKERGKDRREKKGPLCRRGDSYLSFWT